MGLQRRSSNRFQSSIWPGFVDAMTGLLLVLMFVLTIFTVVQFVLRDTISGQESQLDLLSSELAIVAEALNLSDQRGAELDLEVNDLSGQLATADALARDLAGQVAAVTLERDVAQTSLADAQTAITGFEAQVAGLLASQTQDRATITGLEEARAELLTQSDALNLALATARDEIDAEAETARLAAARADALDALVADLEAQALENQETIASTSADLSAAETARLAEAAAAEALRARLADADTELTAMTLALEEQRQEAEDTLTLLAAADAAKSDIDTQLVQTLAALSAQQAAQALLEDENADLAAAQGDAAALQAQLAEALTDVQRLQAQVAVLSEDDTSSEATQAELQAQLATALSAQTTAEDALSQEQDRLSALLDTANTRLTQEEELSAEAQRQVALLNQQTEALRTQLSSLQALLNLADEADGEAEVQIEALTSQLNTALARAATEAQRRIALETAERERLEVETARLAEEAARLEAEAQDLEQFRSDFFGRVREVVAELDGVSIAGDRFVFSSEVLFGSGSADLSPQGEAEIANVAGLLRQISADIPDGIDWVIRVDGHTDNIPLSGEGDFANNWELSQARALSVVLFMIESEGIPPGRLAANGFAEYQPLNPENSAAARAQNRRIELKLTER